jgi:hypothetical protein
MSVWKWLVGLLLPMSYTDLTGDKSSHIQEMFDRAKERKAK